MLHLRHATFYIFYARFPTSYLKAIAEHGSRYLPSVFGTATVPPAAAIQLRRSRRFRMRKPADQASFFIALSKILYYLVSGCSKVGYIAMEDWNPYFQRLHGLHVLSPLSFLLVSCILSCILYRTRLMVETPDVRMYRSATTPSTESI